jgi:large exoprotein involved in heme utilization and adhesion
MRFKQMTKQKLIFLGTSWLLSANLSAQIATDGSLGSAQKIEGLQNLEGPVEYQIGEDLGKQDENGRNLFHSFQDFNLRAEEIATFSGS